VAEKMRIEVLYFDGYPTYMAATRIVSEVLSRLGMDAGVELVGVNSDEEAERLRFAGSPTIRVDGMDLFPIAKRGIWALGCRTYATPEGLKGYPTREMILDALAH
jgi:hypothetical protein